MSTDTSILLVDDEKDLLEMVCMALETYKWKVTCLEEPEMVLALLKTQPPDLILMDIYLKTMDGRELCKRIKTTEGFEKLPIILYSAGNISPVSIKESLADDFVAKPFDLKRLAQKILALLGKTTTHTE